jgi:exosortase D (VPLPA-CTERM-specific)
MGRLAPVEESAMSLAAATRRPRTLLFTDLLIAAAVLVTCLAFSGALLELAHRWQGQEEYSHGFLIPVVTLWLLWTRRSAVRASIGQPSWAGPALILVAGLLNITGELSGAFAFSQIGFVVALNGVVLGAGGYPLCRVTFVPIAFLLFAIPLPGFIDAELTLKLQLISSELGAFFIRLLGIPVYLDGNIIDMGNYKLQVVEACSGLRYLYPFLSLSFLAAYLFHTRLWQRILVFLSSIPIAIGMNGFRIGLVGMLVDRWGPQMADGALHLFEGWVVFLACAALLFGEMNLLAIMSGQRFRDVFYPGQPNAKIHNKASPVGLRNALIATLLLLCVACLAGPLVAARGEIVPQRPRFVEFPAHIGDWRGQSSLLDPDTERTLALDDYLLADYFQQDGEGVNLYVAYFASQRKGDSLHSPKNCIPGSGWQISEIRELNSTVLGEGQVLNRVVIKKGAAKQLVYYWFDEQGRDFANEYWARFYRLANSIIENRTDAALVRLVTDVRSDESEQDADRRLRSFMKVALPPLNEFLPSGAASAHGLADTGSRAARL